MLRSAFADIAQAFASRFDATTAKPPELVRIPLGLSDDYDKTPDRAACRAELGISDDELVLFSLGRFSVRRKMDLSPFLECLQHLVSRNRLPPLSLILAGGGNESDVGLARQLIDSLGLQDVVQIEANHSFERKRVLYGAADIFVSLADNHQETFGLTVIEAMAHRLPAVVSDFNGYRELVDHGTTGFCIPTYGSPSEDPWQGIAGLLDPSVLGFYRSQKVALDLAKLAEALVALAANADLRRTMGEAGKAAGAAYRWAAIIPQYEAMWAEQDTRMKNARASENAAQTNGIAPLLTPDFARVFGHFPSRVLNDDTAVKISAYCLDRVAEGFTPTIYAALKGRLQFPMMQEIMGRMGEVPVALGPVIDGACEATGSPRERVVRTFDFLLKHGYIDVEKQD